jgi:TolA-binding protein
MPKSESTEQPAPDHGLLARLRQLLPPVRPWIAAHPRAGLAAAAGLILLLGPPAIILGYRMLSAPKELPKQRAWTLVDAVTALDEGEYGLAQRIAARLRKILPESEAGNLAFVQGAAAAYEAEQYLGRERKDLCLLAANYLEDARQQGFPESRRAEGLFLLGKSLNLSGKYVESRGPLDEALELDLDPQQTSAVHWLLAAAYSKGENRDLPRALENIAAYLSDEELEPTERHLGLLEELRIRYQSDDDAGCEAVLAKIPHEAVIRPEAELIRGRIVLRQAQQLRRESQRKPSEENKLVVKQTYERAIQILRHAQDDPLGDQAIRRSMYLIGVCFLEMQDYPAALAQFERTGKVWLHTPEGMAAALSEADLLRQFGRGDDAMPVYLSMLGAAKEPFANAWIAPDQFRARVIGAFRQYLLDNQFENAVSLGAAFTPLFPRARALEYEADALQDWSTKLRVDAETLNEPEAIAARSKSRELRRRAGRLFGNLAQLDFTTRQYPDDVWRSGEAFLEGHDFRAAVSAFEEYLKYEPRRRRALALIHLGECMLALDRLEEALSVCQECIQFYPTDAASYQARLITSRVYLEMGQIAPAEAMLRENLNGELLTPESKESRDSLFRLGELLQADGRYEEAIQRLREAVERYPETHDAVRARYLIAESYRKIAQGIQEKLTKDTIETTRQAHFKELHKCLTAAVEHYTQVQDNLSSRQERMRLSPREQVILRNAYFSVGNAWFDLHEYEKAIRAYSALINMYQHDPVTLEAFVQIGNCYRRWNKPTEARRTVQQAKLVLNRMGPTTSFNDVTNHSRREWGDLLDWLSTL